MTTNSLLPLLPEVTASVEAASPWGTPSQRVAQRRNKRDALLATAASFFKQQGFVSASLDQMAVQLGITKPTLYYYVPSKADLVHACAMLGFSHAQSALQRVVAEHAAGDLSKALNAYACVVATDFGWCMVRVDEYALPAGLKKGVQVQRKALEQVLQPLMSADTAAAMMMRAVEGVVLSLPKAQWHRLIALLTASGVAQPNPLAIQQQRSSGAEVPSQARHGQNDLLSQQILPDIEQPQPKTLKEEPHIQPSLTVDAPASQPLQKTAQEGRKLRTKVLRAVEQISLF